MPRIAVFGGTGYLASLIKNQNNDKKNKYIFFSESYYESKDDLEKNDIIKLFEKEPVAINNNTIRSGRHRICAMIGRILKNQDYIPIKIVNEN